MLFLLTAAAVASAPQAAPAGAAPVRQAQAMVVIVKAARLSATGAAPEDSVKRLSTIRDRDGTRSSMPLIEFF